MDGAQRRIYSDWHLFCVKVRQVRRLDCSGSDFLVRQDGEDASGKT
jgi:hypothetical protein